MDKHPLVRAAVGVDQQDKGWQGEPRGNGDGDMGDAIGRLGKDLVFASKHTGNAAKLAKVGPDGGIRQGGGDTSEADCGDGVARRPAIDESAPAGKPWDASCEEIQILPILVGGEES